MDELRKELIISIGEAATWIVDGMTVGIGGFANSSHPMAIIRQMIRNGVKDLTVVTSAYGGLETDLLIGAGCVKKLITPCVGAEGLAPVGPFFKWMAETGKIEVWEIEQSMYYASLRAAAQMLPFLPWRGLLGTSYTELNPDLKEFCDPIKGEVLIAVPATSIDVAILHTAYADPYGNVQHVGPSFSDGALRKAAQKTIVEVERIIPNEDIRKKPEATSLYAVDAIVRAPYGAHPFGSPGFYLQDTKQLKEYLLAAKQSIGNQDASFREYLSRYVYEPEDHGDYLEVVGIKQLLSLMEY